MLTAGHAGHGTRVSQHYLWCPANVHPFIPAHCDYHTGMSDPTPTCPMPRSAAVDLYFMEHRAKVIDIAAFLDRIERTADESAGAPEDFRLKALREAIAVLIDGQGDRAKRVLETLSDPTMEPLESAAGMKGAAGAWPGGIPGQDGNPPIQTDA